MVRNKRFHSQNNSAQISMGCQTHITLFKMPSKFSLKKIRQWIWHFGWNFIIVATRMRLNYVIMALVSVRFFQKCRDKWTHHFAGNKIERNSKLCSRLKTLNSLPVVRYSWPRCYLIIQLLAEIQTELKDFIENVVLWNHQWVPCLFTHLILLYWNCTPSVPFVTVYSFRSSHFCFLR